jgi:hypothetical protein
MLRARVGRDEEIQAIIERGRQTRRPLPGWLWLAAAVVAAICATAAAAILLGDTPARPAAQPPRTSGAGFGSGLAIGAAAGLAIGFALARQRRDHSSRKRP